MGGGGDVADWAPAPGVQGGEIIARSPNDGPSHTPVVTAPHRMTRVYASNRAAQAWVSTEDACVAPANVGTVPTNREGEEVKVIELCDAPATFIEGSRWGRASVEVELGCIS